MVRAIPAGLEPPIQGVQARVAEQRRSFNLDWIIACWLVTPLFGGGHTAGEVDEVTPVSPKAIRGHLRFWWRLVKGQHLPNETGLEPVDLMRLREAEVFGSSEMASPFDIEIRVTRRNGYRKVDGHKPYGFAGSSPEMYALFPTTQDRKRQIPAILREGLEFEVRIQWISRDMLQSRKNALRESRAEANKQRAKDGHPLWPQPLDDLKTLQGHVETALWAWLNFGGIGSRTRRGVGAVSTSEARFSLFDEQGRLRNPLPNVTIYAAGGVTDPMDAWAKSVKIYQLFRQGCRGPKHQKKVLRYERKTARLWVKPLPDVNGRTQWPEADSIRQITGCSLNPDVKLRDGVPPHSIHDHRRPVNEDVPLPAFPRALLGLPIIFHFADGPNGASKAAGIPAKYRDPDDAELLPQGASRMSSPVLTRPIQRGQDWLPAVLVFHQAHLLTLAAVLKTKVSSCDVPHSEISNGVFASLPPMCGQANALAAFEAFVEDNGFLALATEE